MYFGWSLFLQQSPDSEYEIRGATESLSIRTYFEQPYDDSVTICRHALVRCFYRKMGQRNWKIHSNYCTFLRMTSCSYNAGIHARMFCKPTTINSPRCLNTACWNGSRSSIATLPFFPAKHRIGWYWSALRAACSGTWMENVCPQITAPIADFKIAMSRTTGVLRRMYWK